MGFSHGHRFFTVEAETRLFNTESCCLVSPDHKFLSQSQTKLNNPPPRSSIQLIGGPKPHKMSPHTSAFAPLLHLAQLKEQIDGELCKGLTQSGFLQHWLHMGEINFPTRLAKDALKNAILVGLDAEWYEFDPTNVTELGISIVDPVFVQDRSSPYGPLQSMVTHHVRIKKNAHLINSQLCQGYPEKFQFGTTSFADMEQAKKMLRNSFIRYDVRGNLRPVILIGHAVDNDVQMIKERFDLDIDQLGVVVATVDTQELAIEANLCHPSRKIRLAKLLEKFGITEKYLHNAGNDIVCTMLIALVMQLHVVGFEHGKAYADLKADQVPRSSPGNPVFCIRCDSTKHLASSCRMKAHCTICASHPVHFKDAGTHQEEKCLQAVKNAAIGSDETLRRRSPSSPKTPVKFLRFACPCSLCIESTDLARYDMEHAYGHKNEDCPFKS